MKNHGKGHEPLTSHMEAMKCEERFTTSREVKLCSQNQEHRNRTAQ